MNTAQKMYLRSRNMRADKDREENKEEYTFIQEKIVPRPKNTKKKLVKLTCYTVILSIIFGVVSSFAFNLSNHLIGKWNKQSVKEPISLEDNERENQPFVTPQENASEEEAGSEDSSNKHITDLDIYRAYDIRSYQKMYSVMRELANNCRYSMVTVEAIKDVTSWFDKENSERSYGLIISMQEDYIYILCNYNKIKDANKTEVEFYNQDTVRAEFMNYNKETSLALLKAKTSALSKRTKVKIEEVKLGDSYQIGRGTPVLGLGSPDGTMQSMVIGYITAPRIEKYITDGKLGLYHTSIAENPYGDGFFVDVEGKVIGIITHQFKDETDQDIMSFLDISQLKPVIESLLNGRKLPYLGVKVSELSSNDGKKLNVNFGIYITDVIANSPAFKKGLRPGDVITEIDGTSISSVAALMKKMAEKEPGDKMKLIIVRQTKAEYPKVISGEKQITVTLD